MKDPVLVSVPFHARTNAFCVGFVSLVCLYFSVFILKDPVGVGMVLWFICFAGMGLFSLCGVMLFTLRRVSRSEAAFTWRVGEDGRLTSLGPGWYCLLRARNHLIYVPKRLVFEIDRQDAYYGSNGRTVHAVVLFKERVTSPRTIALFRAWWLRFERVCVSRDVRLMMSHLDQHPPPKEFQVSLQVREWEYKYEVPF